jgi:hypothetical protein
MRQSAIAAAIYLEDLCLLVSYLTAFIWLQWTKSAESGVSRRGRFGNWRYSFDAPGNRWASIARTLLAL